jgi:hypothetical protein
MFEKERYEYIEAYNKMEKKLTDQEKKKVTELLDKQKRVD